MHPFFGENFVTAPRHIFSPLGPLPCPSQLPYNLHDSQHRALFSVLPVDVRAQNTFAAPLTRIPCPRRAAACTGIQFSPSPPSPINLFRRMRTYVLAFVHLYLAPAPFIHPVQLSPIYPTLSRSHTRLHLGSRSCSHAHSPYLTHFLTHSSRLFDAPLRSPLALAFRPRASLLHLAPLARAKQCDAPFRRSHTATPAAAATVVVVVVVTP